MRGRPKARKHRKAGSRGGKTMTPAKLAALQLAAAKMRERKKLVREVNEMLL